MIRKMYNKYLMLLALMMGMSVGAMANDTYTGGYHATGVDGNTVYLNDLEDHTWTYYSGVDASVDGGNYNTNYKGLIYSPNPRNVKIIYRGGGVSGASAVAVSGTESQNTFVYFETLEKNRIDMDGDYPYHIIPNPFCKRPAVTNVDNTKTYYGFAGWKVISGAEYIVRESGKTAAVNNTTVLDLEEFIHFQNLGKYGTSTNDDYDGNNDIDHPIKEVILEATWTQANVYVGTTAPTSTTFPSNGTYETNFWVVNGSISLPTLNIPCTITMLTPDGTSQDYRSSYSISSSITVNSSFDNTVKLEWITHLNNGNINANGKKLFIGRGFAVNGRMQTIYATQGSNNVNQTLRIESGSYTTITHYNSTPIKSFEKQIFILGCDYDRAKQDNTQLDVLNGCNLTNAGSVGITDIDDKKKFMSQLYLKSGDIISSVRTTDQGMNWDVYYFGMIGGAKDVARRYFEVQGGTISGICGGASYENSDLTIRAKGGEIRTIIYGGATYGESRGKRNFIMTGGLIKGWISGGANGTYETNGILYGSTYIYIGGYFNINSNGSTTPINRSLPGNVFGAGCGYSATSTAGRVTGGTNVVVADHAYVERGVYGGGSYGYSQSDTETPSSSHIYITGGEIEGKSGGVDGNIYDSSVNGGVFGGACQNKGGNTFVYMTGGLVGGKGVYGGSNKSGIISGNTNLKIMGGTIGTSTTPANIHGGGYGASTDVTGNVSVAIGSEPSGTDKTANKENISDLTIYGAVYGGSALGKTNTGSSKTTSVKMYSGTVNGDVYGGALGSTSAYATIGATSQTVDIYGGKVTGGVYGGSNINASLTASTKPQLGVTIHDTYTPTVAGEYAIGNVFGGGNGATVAASGQPGAHDTNTNGTFVTVEKGSIGNVFGGGNAATAMKTTVNVADGTIGNIYGGSNQANINGTTSITVSGGTVNTGIYGGCNALGNVTGLTNVNITGGTVGDEASLANIHGGGYGQSTTTGNDVKVTIGALTDGKGSTAGPTIYADIYGGSALGSVCSSTASPVNTSTVNIYSGNILKGNVYGGGLGSKNGVNGATDDVAAVVNGNTQVNVYAAHFGSDSEVFGGNNLNGSPTGSTTVHVYETEKPTQVHENQTSFPGEVADNPWSQYAIKGVYGGSNKATFHSASDIGETNVIVDDCNSSIAYVYGGSNAADVYGSTNVTINGADKIGVVFGGGNGKGNDNPGANVLKNSDNTAGGNTTTTINGGTVDFVFGGSNTLGDVKGKATVNLEDNSGACTYLLGEVYGAGNAADMHGTPELNIGCITGLGTIYGGARNANLYSDVNLNITGGTYKKIFGGNNLGGTLDGSITVNIEETGCQPINIDNLYAGGNQAAYSTPSGKSDPIINIKSATSIGNVYGGGLGSTAIITGNPTVNINMEPGVLNKGTASESVQPLGTIGNVFGGGDAAETKGNTTINLATESGKSAPITGNVYGGGNQAAVDGNTTINATGGTAANIFGGGNGYIDADNSANNKAADVTGNTTVNLTGTQISTALYGGCNALGTVGGDAKLDMTGGKVGPDNPSSNTHTVFGGGYGQQTAVSGNVDVNIGTINADGTTYTGTTVINGNIYGGSALGTVGTSGVTTNHVNVVLNSGSVGGSLYGGGLGRKADATASPAITAVEAKVYSPVQVTMNGGSIAGDIFGCNNLNGAPQSMVQVDINKTAALQTSPLKYAVNAVYGGGNLADAAITPTVNINDCYVNIGSVYGGGNAAATSGTNATIWGGTIGNAFGGGNGESGVAADVNGNSVLNIYGGTVTNAFAGSNMHGTISGTMALNVGGASTIGPCECDLNVANTYGGGNQAEGKGATITIGCGSGYLGNVYGGAKAAKINGDLVLNIEGGEIDNVFGGNDQSGEITGDITVNIKTGGCNDAKIKNVYGGGNMAPFNHNTTVNLINGKVGYYNDDNVLQGGNVFGGGYGSTAVVTGNTIVNLCSDETHTFEVLDGIYGGGELANVSGNPTINLTKGKAQNIYGGGKEANIDGSTTVNMGGTAEISTGIYGGCNVQGTVTGATAVNLNGGTLGTSTTHAKGTFGGGYGAQTLVNGNVVVEEKGTTVYGDIYGGSALGNVNGTIAEGATEPTATADATTHVTLTSGSVTGNIYGGGLGQQHADAIPAQDGNPAVAEVPAIAAKVFGPVTVALNGGSLTGNAFGCNYLYGAPQSTVNVELNSTQDAAVVTGNMYGGGNVVAYTGNPSVAVKAGTLNGSVFGGGLGSTAIVTGNPQVNITGGTVTGTVYGGGDEADVTGGTTVKITGAETKVNGDVFGGGNNASVSGPTNVQVGGS